jgi:hypothetical protein
MRRITKLRSARLTRKLYGWEIAEKLGMYVIRYMAIEIEWEEPNAEEIQKICEFFGMSPQSLGLFGSKLLLLPQCEVPSERNATLEESTVMQLKLW